MRPDTEATVIPLSPFASLYRAAMRFCSAGRETASAG